jgi:hypothetical protein
MFVLKKRVKNLFLTVATGSGGEEADCVAVVEEGVVTHSFAVQGGGVDCAVFDLEELD